jgi:hypothetical protein
VLRLRISRSDDSVPFSFRSGTEVWHDVHGRPVGYGHAGDRWLHLPGVATFRFSSEGVEAVANGEVAVARIRDAHRRLVLPLALQALGQEVLHASAVVFDAGAVAFCAGSGTGKTTVAYSLALRGHPPCADDAVAVDLTGRRGPEVIPLPFALRLRPASASFYGRDAQPMPVQHPSARRPLAAVCVLERRDEGGGLRRLGSAEAFRALLAHAYVFGLNDDARKRHMVKHYLRLASQVPVFQVRLASGLSTLTGTLDEIEQAVA